MVVVELCPYRVSMLKMDEGALLQEAKELSLGKLQQAVRQVRCRAGAGRAPPQAATLPALPACEHAAFQAARRPRAGEGHAFIGFQTREVRWVSFSPQGGSGQGPKELGKGRRGGLRVPASPAQHVPLRGTWAEELGSGLEGQEGRGIHCRRGGLSTALAQSRNAGGASPRV